MQQRIYWRPSNCKCECDKSYDAGEYLDYENCKRRKKLVDRLAEQSSDEEFTENVDEVKTAEMTLTECNSIECNSLENIHKCSSCTLYIVSFSIIFTANIGVGAYFIYFIFIGT